MAHLAVQHQRWSPVLGSVLVVSRQGLLLVLLPLILMDILIARHILAFSGTFKVDTKIR